MITKRITVYQSNCCKENNFCIRRTKKSALNHELNCCLNPANRTCATCAYVKLVYFEYNKSNFTKDDEATKFKLYICTKSLKQHPLYNKNCKYYFNKNITKSDLNYEYIGTLNTFHLKFENDDEGILEQGAKKFINKYGIVYGQSHLNIKQNDIYLCSKYQDIIILLEEIWE